MARGNKNISSQCPHVFNVKKYGKKIPNKHLIYLILWENSMEKVEWK